MSGLGMVEKRYWELQALKEVIPGRVLELNALNLQCPAFFVEQDRQLCLPLRSKKNCAYMKATAYSVRSHFGFRRTGWILRRWWKHCRPPNRWISRPT